MCCGIEKPQIKTRIATRLHEAALASSSTSLQQLDCCSPSLPSMALEHFCSGPEPRLEILLDDSWVGWDDRVQGGNAQYTPAGRRRKTYRIRIRISVRVSFNYITIIIIVFNHDSIFFKVHRF